MTAALGIILAQGTPLAPPLQTRLIALLVVEGLLLTTAVLLYILWARLKKRPLEEWWAERKAAGFSPRTRALMEESKRQRLAAEGQQVEGQQVESRPNPPREPPAS